MLPICGLTIIESTYAITDLYLGTILFSTMIFIWCILNPNKLNFKITNLIGGKLYGYIYILHIFVVFTVTTILSYLVYLFINKILTLKTQVN